MPKKTTTRKTVKPAVARTAHTGSSDFLAAAMALPSRDVRPMRADVALAVTNVRRGVAAVLAHRDVVANELPRVSLNAIGELEALGEALTTAAGEVERWAAPPKDTKKLLARARVLRELLLSSAEALALAGILPGPTVAKIREGRGSFDTAGDCVALASLMQAHGAKIRGKVPFGPAEIKEAKEVGAALQRVLVPKGAHRKPSDDLARAANTRDRLWTLFEDSWEKNVWRAGAWLFGREVDAHVPPLQSRTVGKRAPAPPPPPPTS